MSKGILTQLAKSWQGRDWLAAKQQLFLFKLLSNCSVSGTKSHMWTMWQQLPAFPTGILSFH